MRRSLHWAMAMVGVRADRARRPQIREERLRTAAGLRTTPPATMSAWRGRSSRRYVVSVLPLDYDIPDRLGACVPIAVRRDEAGLAHIVAVGSEHRPVTWWASQREAGANELHIFRLAEDAEERAAVAMDLTA